MKENNPDKTYVAGHIYYGAKRVYYNRTFLCDKNKKCRGNDSSTRICRENIGCCGNRLLEDGECGWNTDGTMKYKHAKDCPLCMDERE
jgi:hypothetical protein